MSLHFYSSVNDSCKYIQSSLQIEKTKIEFINVLKLYYSKIQLYFFKSVFLSNVRREGIISMYESFLSTPGGSEIQGSEIQVFQWESLFNKQASWGLPM